MNGNFSKEFVQVDLLLSSAYARNQLDDVNMFIYALIKKEKSEKQEMIQVLIEILQRLPLFWSAWVELCKVLIDMDSKDAFEILSRLDNHWAKNFFTVNLVVENIRIHDRFEEYCFGICYGLICFFTDSNFVLTLLSIMFHNISDYDKAGVFLNQILINDPFRYENTDILSNIFYVKEKHNELGKLAISCFENDKYLPETCCVLGNYYSMIDDHNKAIIYFRRAIALDKNCLAAYTLLGHEYLELKNAALAIEAYNACVQINKSDFRAWYGLGQAYELQNYMNFAIYYFLQALAANPRDSRMWNALSNCYEKIGKRNEAAKCLEKAEAFKDHEGISMVQLGKLYDIMNMKTRAVQCFEEILRKREGSRIIEKDIAETLLYLARYFKSEGDFEKAMLYATRLLDSTGNEKQEAQNIIYELNALK